MDQLKKKTLDLQSEVEDSYRKLEIDKGSAELSLLKKQAESADFWQDNLKAQRIMKQISKDEQRINPWVKLKSDLSEVAELVSLDDASMQDEISSQLEKIAIIYGELKEELKLNGRYDNNDVIMSIYAGAGGTDAQDWAQMLLRMYSRWAEKNKMTFDVIDQTAGEEAGIKSVTIEISGPYAYGKLKSEHGVHRLVRLSPFNSDNLRQTSFAKVDILPKIEQANEIDIDDKDLRIDVYRSGGHGGQSVNTTDSAVRVTHIPTNISIAIQNERSQTQNKELAMTILRSRLAQLKMEQHAEKLAELKGPVQSAEWGNQIRSYVLHPYKQVKDLRSLYETNEPDKVLDGDINALIEAFLEYSLDRNN